MRGVLIVISGPSGTGKGTVCHGLCRQNQNLYCSVSATTRFPRKGENEGENYYFLTKERFQELAAQGAFLEWAEVYGNYYGTPGQQVKERLAQGFDVILEIDTQGAKQIRAGAKEAVFIFLLPPSMEELWQRIQGRGTDSPDVIKQRFAAVYRELQEIREYDYAVFNENVPDTVKVIEAIILAEKCRVIKGGDFLSRFFKEGEQGDLPLY